MLNCPCFLEQKLTAPLTGVRNGQNTKRFPSADTIFYKRVYSRLSENGKMKMSHSYQKEKNHKPLNLGLRQ